MNASWDGIAGWANKAKNAIAEHAQTSYEGVANPSRDLEAGGVFNGTAGPDKLFAWAKGTADRAFQGVQQVADKASSADWSGHAKGWQGDIANTFGKVTDAASVASSKASATLNDGAKLAQQNAARVAGSAKSGLEKAGSGFAGMGALAMSPIKMIQAAGIFMLGFLLISISMSFLPMLPINPAKFSLLFGMGSVTMLGSVAWLRGPMSFAAIALQRDKLPFSICYGIGLLGTFWATLIARSYLFTSFFAFLQCVGLLYFLASFVPGGKTVLNFFGRITGRTARLVVGR